MERRFQTGTVISAIAHAGLILWVLVGDWLFAAERPAETMTITATTITSDEFAALQAATLTPAKEPAPVRPQARPEEVVPEEVVPPPVEEPPVVEPSVEEPPVEDIVPAEPPPPPPSEAEQAAVEQLLPSESTDVQPIAEAAEIVAPDPVQPETEADTSDTPAPAVTEDPAAETVVDEPPTEAAVAEDTGDVVQTEANVAQTEETGMTTSIRPRSRPEKPAPEPQVAAAEPEVETPPVESATLTVQPVDDTATEDAIAALLNEAADAPADPSADAGGQDLPQGPPLTGGEMGDISSAISRKWNLGASSTDALSTVVVLRVTFDENGKPISFDVLEADGPSQAGIDNIVRTAKSAVTRAYTQDGGLPLPPDKYATWRVLDLVFDAKGMRAR